MPNVWSKEVCVQGFNCETINLKNMLALLNTWRLLKLFTKLEDVVEPSY